MTLLLRSATIDDLSLLNKWDLDDAVNSSGGDDDNYDWEYELPRCVAWREFLIAEVDSEPVGMLVLIDALMEESHYWGEDVLPNTWAIDIWIGDQAHRSMGYGTEMMAQALRRCFMVHGASSVLIDPLQSNVRAISFYRRLGFKTVGPRRFENDDCLVLMITEDDYHCWDE